MTKRELKDYLLKCGFTFEHDNEYNRDVYTNDKFCVKSQSTKLVIYVCYYTMRFEWWYEKTNKVGTSFYLNRILPNFDAEFICKTIEDFQSAYDIKF